MQPLAERLRPKTLDDYIGQKHLVGPGAILRKMIDAGRISSFILWGPPGVDMNGKLFNRIPLIKNLKWREMFRVRALWGTLTDKNNPFKSSNPDLFRFPTRDGKFTSFVMDPKVPYIEGSIGIYNIFKLLHVEYVHRFTYRDNPGINKNGIRFMVLMVF